MIDKTHVLYRKGLHSHLAKQPRTNLPLQLMLRLSVCVMFVVNVSDVAVLTLLLQIRHRRERVLRNGHVICQCASRTYLLVKQKPGLVKYIHRRSKFIDNSRGTRIC